MEREMTYLDCPAYLDAQGHVRCGLPAEVEHRYTMGSTDGPLESARIRCPMGHWFSGPVPAAAIKWLRRTGSLRIPGLRDAAGECGRGASGRRPRADRGPFRTSGGRRARR